MRLYADNIFAFNKRFCSVSFCWFGIDDDDTNVNIGISGNWE